MKEIRRFKKELRELERGMEFLDSSQTRMEKMLRDLGEFANCNMYVNYSALRMNVEDAINHFYNVMKSQMISSAQHLEAEIAKQNY